MDQRNSYQQVHLSSEAFFPGEKVDADINGREAVHLCPYNGEVPGRLYLTNFRIFFVSSDSNKSKSLWVPLGTINKVDKFGGVKSSGENSYGLEITCKDIRTLKFALAQENHSRRDVFEKLKQYAFVLTHNPNMKLFCFDAKMTYPEDNGWSIYDPIAEFKRMGLPNELWRITKVNERYKLCDTYPAILVVPQMATDDDLWSVAAFRSRGRLPVLSWINAATQASITRCSQPLTGIGGSRSQDDEKYLQSIMDANAQSDKIHIIDARPLSNALANRTRGGGVENENLYSNAEIQFCDIYSIHVMRESLRKVSELCYPGGGVLEEGRFYEELEATSWLGHIRLILSGAIRIVDKIEYQKTSVIVHCSDGWDRTAQLTSTAMLLLDPYYRTLKGFEVLIEKEWLSFGHKFAQRLGHGEDKSQDDNRSPIFLQWLDVVWQLLRQFPTAFEFNESLLITIADHMYSCLFGTFLCNTECQRKVEGLATKTKSIWSMINSDREMYLNPLYTSAPNTSNATISAAPPRDHVLVPRCSAPFIQFWNAYFFRWNLRVAPPSVEQIQLRSQELLRMRQAIQKRMEELQHQLQSKYSRGSLGGGGPTSPGGDRSATPGSGGGGGPSSGMPNLAQAGGNGNVNNSNMSAGSTALPVIGVNRNM